MPSGVYIRTDKIKASLSAARKKNWADPNCKYNSEEFRKKQRILHLGEKNHNYDKPVTEEKKRKQSESMKKIRADPNSVYNSAEWRNKISKQHNDPKSIYQSKEYREKISKANTGKIHSAQGRLNHSLAVRGEKHPMWGKHHTEESKEKKRIASINMWNNPNSKFNTKEYRKNLSKSLSGKNHPMYGKHHSIESNNKRKETMKNNWKDLTSTFNTSLYKEKRSILHKKHKNTEPELKVKSILNKLNIEYESQKMIYPYPIDFFIPSCNLCIEVDGTYSHGDPRKYKLNDLVQGGKTAKIKWEKDKKRDKYLESLGYKTIRFWEYDINKDLNLIEELIKISIIQNS